MRNPNWKFYPLTERSQVALSRVSAKIGFPLTAEYLRRANNKRMRDARLRIAEALKVLVAEKQCITISGLARKSGTDRRTVKKHADLWRGFYGTSPRSAQYGFAVVS
jgi:hypothetical protein